MVEVTPIAAWALALALERSEVESEQGLRLKEESDGLALDVDVPHQDDHVIDYQGTVVLMVNKELEHEIGEAVIDLENGDAGNELVIRRRYSITRPRINGGETQDSNPNE